MRADDELLTQVSSPGNAHTHAHAHTLVQLGSIDNLMLSPGEPAIGVRCNGTPLLVLI